MLPNSGTFLLLSCPLIASFPLKQCGGIPFASACTFPRSVGLFFLMWKTPYSPLFFTIQGVTGPLRWRGLCPSVPGACPLISDSLFFGYVNSFDYAFCGECSGTFYASLQIASRPPTSSQRESFDRLSSQDPCSSLLLFVFFSNLSGGGGCVNTVLFLL